MAAFSSSEQCEDNPLPVVELEEWCKDNALVEDDLLDNDYQVEHDYLDNEVDCLEDERDDCLIYDDNCLDDKDSQLENDHENTEAESYLSEGAPESDKLSDTPDISDEMISSDEDEIFELKPMITESKTNASPLAKLYEPSIVKERSLNEMKSCCTIEKPTHHNDSQAASKRCQQYVHSS